MSCSLAVAPIWTRRDHAVQAEHGSQASRVLRHPCHRRANDRGPAPPRGHPSTNTRVSDGACRWPSTCLGRRVRGGIRPPRRPDLLCSQRSSVLLSRRKCLVPPYAKRGVGRSTTLDADADNLPCPTRWSRCRHGRATGVGERDGSYAGRDPGPASSLVRQQGAGHRPPELPPIHDVCRARAARAPVRQPLVGVGRSRSRSHRRRSGSRLFAGFGIVDPAPSFEQ